MSWIMILMVISTLVSLSFFLTKHPLSMGCALLMQTVLISMMTGLLNLNFWYSFILFLIMIGGMLILFIYMTSVASNEKFEFSSTTMMMFTLLFLISLTTAIMMESSTMMNMETLTQMTQQTTLKQSWMLSLTKFMNYPQNFKLMMLMSYLFLALIAIVKITNIKYGPLRTSSN